MVRTVLLIDKGMFANLCHLCERVKQHLHKELLQMRLRQSETRHDARILAFQMGNTNTDTRDAHSKRIKISTE